MRPLTAPPAGLDGSGVPIGVRLLARRGREDPLLSVAAQHERLTPLATQPDGAVRLSLSHLDGRRRRGSGHRWVSHTLAGQPVSTG